MDVTSKLAFRSGLTVETLLAARFLAAAAVLFLLVLTLDLQPRPRLRQALGILLLGACGYAVESILLNSAFLRMPVSAAILIFYIYPAIIALFAVTIRKERLGIPKAIALSLSLVAVALLLSFPVHGMTVPGLLLALGAAAAFATYALVAERTVGGVHPLVFSAFVLVGAGSSVAIVGRLTGSVPVGLGLASGRWILLHTLLIGLAVVGFLGAMKSLGAVGAAMGITMEPALAVALSVLVLGEHVGAPQIVGGALLIVAISLLPLFRRDESATDESKQSRTSGSTEQE